MYEAKVYKIDQYSSVSICILKNAEIYWVYHYPIELDCVLKESGKTIGLAIKVI